MLYDMLHPFLHHDLLAWPGLPAITVAELTEALGQPADRDVTTLGFYPADHYTYPLEAPSQGITVYARHQQVVLIQALVPPPTSAMAELPEPCGIKAQEILVPGAYAHEYVYCDRGLVLTVAKALNHHDPDCLVRCRGIQPIATVEAFGPDFYRPFEDQMYW